jgi:predicted methyltransferase
MSDQPQPLPRGTTVRVEFADGSHEIGGILEWDAAGYYKVTIPAESACRWVPAHAVSEFAAAVRELIRDFDDYGRRTEKVRSLLARFSGLNTQIEDA